MIAVVDQPRVLTIAGSDSSGGAGIQADLKAFAALNVHGASALTAITAQNRSGVFGIETMPADFVVKQIKAVHDEQPVDAVKTGMLANREIVAGVATCLRQINQLNIVVDPVMVATSGARLLDDDCVAVLIKDLLPLARVITPNLPEAAVLLGEDVATSRDDMERHAIALADLIGTAVLLKGGHLMCDGNQHNQALDLLAHNDRVVRLEDDWVFGADTHGTGCTLSAALAANLANGLDLLDACKRAKTFVSDALRKSARPGRKTP